MRISKHQNIFIGENIKQEIKNIVSEMKLVAEDIKGALVDESV